MLRKGEREKDETLPAVLTSWQSDALVAQLAIEAQFAATFTGSTAVTLKRVAPLPTDWHVAQIARPSWPKERNMRYTQGNVRVVSHLIVLFSCHVEDHFGPFALYLASTLLRRPRRRRSGSSDAGRLVSRTPVSSTWART